MKQNLPYITYLATNFWMLLGVFIVFLAALHLILVWWLKLGKVAWKRVDYIWLAFAALGLLSTSSEARRLLATNLLENQKAFTSFAYSDFQRQVQFGRGPAICREFSLTQYSPENLNEIQRQYDAACEYYKSLAANLPQELPENFEQVEIHSKVIRPAVTDRNLLEGFNRLDQVLREYNQAQRVFDELAASQSRSKFEVDTIILGPLLLALALALRITKVTGEIKLDANG